MTEEIYAEMAANVWKVVCKAGDTVAEGDTIVIVESMKMEIPLLASVDGVIRMVCVSEGQTVQEGEVVAIIDS